MTLPQRITVTVADGIQQAAADARYSRADSGSNGLLASSAGTSATSVTLRQALPGIVEDCYIAINPFSTNCKLRKITGVSSTTYSFTGALGVLMAADTLVVPFYVSEFSALLFGATGDGSTDDAAAINAAITAVNGLGGGVVVLPYGTYTIGSAISLQQHVTLRMTKNTVISTTADINVIELEKETGIDGGGGKIYINNDSYTKAALYLAGAEQLHFDDGESNRIANLNIEAEDQAGIGIHIYCDGDNAFDYVTGVTFDQVHVTKFQYGLRVQCIEGDNTCFANDNRFVDCWWNYNTYPISLEGGATDPNAVQFNQFVNCSIQTSVATTLPLYIEGSRNVFTNFGIWDFSGAPTVSFGSESYGNMLTATHLEPQQILDHGERNHIMSALYSSTPLGQVSDTTALPRLHAQYGMHDDQMAYADELMTITQTSGSAITAGSWANVFNETFLDRTVRWGASPAPTFPIVVEFEFGFTITGLSGVGFNFVNNNLPSGFKVELYDDDDTEWDTIYNASSLGSNYRNIYISTINLESGTTYRASTYSEMRITISGAQSSGAVEISTIYMHSAHRMGRRWARRHAPIFTGVANFAGTMGNSALDPTSDAPADWVQVQIGGTDYYLPAYAAS